MELQDLALRIRRGDRDALKTLISEYGVGVYQKAYQKTQDKTLAREATRQTFAQLVTSLQEQTDLDGWELWLNALAKRNIETYCNIGSDMAYLENQLNDELFSGDTETAKIAPPAPDAAGVFAREQQREAQRKQQMQQEAQLKQQKQQEAQLLAAQYAAQQQAQLQQEYEAKLFEQQQYEAMLRRQYEAEQQQTPAIQPGAEPAAEAVGPAQKPLPSNGRSAEKKKSGHKRPARSAGKDERLFPKKRGSTACVVALLMLLCILLVWLVVGVAMSLQWLPELDLGYEWFNANIIELF